MGGAGPHNKEPSPKITYLDRKTTFLPRRSPSLPMVLRRAVTVSRYVRITCCGATKSVPSCWTRMGRDQLTMLLSKLP